MKDAAITWAVVVGIDAYQSFKPLTGAVADAARAVTWLRALGVPDAQILLHAAPTDQSRPVADALGLPYGGCTEPEIWTSFEKLIGGEAARLFVFLTGHGFYEPGGHRVFLTQEAKDLVLTNLGIEWYAALLRGLGYKRQFIVMDGCLNLPYTASERARFAPGQHAGVQLPPPRPDVAQWLCTSASQGERALEIDGHGLFLPALLDALDPARPHEFCTAIDPTTGALEYDLARAVDTAAGPIVTRRAAAEHRSQYPAIVRLDAGPATPRVPVITVEPERTATVRVRVDPTEAEAAVRQIRLSSDDYVWQLVVPTPADPVLTYPVESVLPAGLQLSVRCTVSGGGWAQPPQRELVVTGPSDVVFRLERADALGEVAVKTVGPAGTPVPAMDGNVYREVEAALAPDAVPLRQHETGPGLVGDDPDRLPGRAFRVARAINDATPPHVTAEVRGVDAARVRTTLAFTVDARRLAGVLAGEEIVLVGGASYAPAALGREVDVEPGLVPVEVTLPWGRWATVVQAREGDRTEVELPATVGLPPMRVRLLTAESADAPERTIVTAGGDAARGTVLPAGGAGAGTVEPAPDLRAWDGPMSLATSDAPRWRAVAELDNGWRLPLHESGTLGVDLTNLAEPRAEPLSTTPAPEWDALVSSGRLTDLPYERAVGLTQQKWFDPVLGLAGAYACYAQDADDYVDVVLRNLGRIDSDLPDVPLLAGATDRRRGRRRADVAEALARLAEDGGVPLFRWGVAAGVLAAEHYGVTTLATALRDVEQRLAPSSVWTVWRR